MSRKNFAILNPDGLPNSFECCRLTVSSIGIQQAPTVTQYPDRISSAKLLSGGNFTTVGGQGRVGIARLNAETIPLMRVLHRSCQIGPGSVNSIKIQPDGKSRHRRPIQHRRRYSLGTTSPGSTRTDRSIRPLTRMPTFRSFDSRYRNRTVRSSSSDGSAPLADKSQ